VSLRAYARAPAGEPELVFRLPHDPWPAYAWAFPTGPEEANVGVVLLDGRTPSSRAALASLLAEALPEWAPLPGTVRGFHLPLSPGRPALAGGRVLLAGDAAGLVNPMSGEGIATALVSGMLAGRSAVGDPSRAGRVYRAAVRRHLGRHLRHAGWAARAMRSRAWTDATVAAADADTSVFTALAELTVGTGPFPPAAGARIGLRRVGALRRN
jgi:menaquinone-9 beta-reductase